MKAAGQPHETEIEIMPNWETTLKNVKNIETEMKGARTLAKIGKL